MISQHPFSKYVAILARGKTKSRSFTQNEAQDAMAMILRGEAEPEQIGAFLMLLRLREETPEEIAGFTLGARDVIAAPVLPAVDLDWSSYAGKRRQLPWFILTVLLLAQNGVRIFMHGTEGHTPGRMYTRNVLEALGFPISTSLHDASAQIEKSNFAYLPLENLCPQLQRLIDLRPIFGLRSPVHSFARMLNPLDAPVMMQGIFHRGFMDIHAEAAVLLKQPTATVFRGEGGEIERRPNKPTVAWTSKQEIAHERWPAILDDGHASVDERMDIDDLRDVWSGKPHEYGVASVVGTLAITLKALGRADDMKTATGMAEALWSTRELDIFDR